MGDGIAMPTRRQLLKGIAAAGGVLAVPVGSTYAFLHRPAAQPAALPPLHHHGGIQQVDYTKGGTPVTPAPFQVAMPIPPVLAPVARSVTTDYYRMTVRAATTELLPGKQTPVLTFEGAFPGPTIQAKSNRRTVITQVNQLTEPISVHLHGGVVDPANDGDPMDTIAPGASRDYTYENKQVAASLWYHDHAHHLESEHVYRGMAGMYLLCDDNEASLGLPSGAYDVPLTIRDVGISADGALIYEDDFNSRPTILVNGKPQPYFKVAARRYRFRLLNASNLRPFSFRLSTGGTFQQISTDRGLLPAPIPMTDLALSPGERADIVVDFAAYPVGTSIVLQNTLFPVDTTKEIMRFDVVRTATDTSRVPAKLATLPAMAAATITRDFELHMDDAAGLYLINGKEYDPARVDTSVRWGATEIWQIRNVDPIPHDFHIHLVDFRVLDVNGVAPVIGKTALKDTVAVMPGETARILVTFNFPYAGRYPYHCHLMDHSSAGMMGQLEILR